MPSGVSAPLSDSAGREPVTESGRAKTSNRKPNYVAVVFLMFANVVMTINQVNTAAVYNLIGADFHQGVYGLGILTAAFFLAYGAFEVPGGVLAARVGPRRLIIVGTVANGLSVIGSGLAPQFGMLVAFRFLAGLGFSFAFPSILVLIVRYFREGSEGLGGSLMFVSGGLGMILGFTPWVILSQAVGWRAGFVLGGLLDLFSVAFLVLLLPRDRSGSNFAIRLAHLRSVVFNRQLAVLSIALLGFGTFIGITSNFTTFYLENHLGVTPAIASSVTELSVVFPMVTSPVSGRLFDRLRRPKELILTAALGSAAGLGLISLGSVGTAIAGVAVAGLATGVFSIGLIVAREIASSNPEYESLTVAWVDSFSLYGNFIAPLYFSALVLSSGYGFAFGMSAIVGLLLAAPILAMSNTQFFRRRATN